MEMNWREWRGKGVGRFRKTFNMITAGEDEHGLTGGALKEGLGRRRVLVWVNMPMRINISGHNIQSD